MNKCNSIESIDLSDLSEPTKFRLDEISNIENYFIEEINQRKSCSKKSIKYVAAFDYIDKILIVLSAAIGGVSICLLFVYKYCWCNSWNSKCKLYFNFVSINMNN